MDGNSELGLVKLERTVNAQDDINPFVGIRLYMLLEVGGAKIQFRFVRPIQDAGYPVFALNSNEKTQH